MLLNRHKNKEPVIIDQVVSAEIEHATEKVVISETETTNEELTKAQIVEQLKAKGVDFDARQNKETLLVLLKAGE